ncbi:hypothetical protein BKA57DRAFT_533189 [Linnemannia elongata]|nr:hypothetical protein BKA57DRAFT_533189 [Linnemannia elongata]
MATILTGPFATDLVFIPRVPNLTTDDKTSPIIFKRRQFPVKPAFAMTINKSQGQTLENVGLYLPTPVFTHSQLYVALSRCTDERNLKVLIIDGSIPRLEGTYYMDASTNKQDILTLMTKSPFFSSVTPNSPLDLTPFVTSAILVRNVVSHQDGILTRWYGRRFQFPNTYLSETKDDDMPNDDLPATVFQELAEEIEDNLGADTSDFSVGDGELNFYYEYTKQGLFEDEGGYPD